MNTICCKLSDQYLAALRKHLAEGTETDLSAAAKLGRKALRLGVSVADMSLIHEEAQLALLPPELVTEDSEKLSRWAGAFFRQTLAPLEAAVGASPPPVAAEKQPTSTGKVNIVTLKKQLQRETLKCKLAEKISKEQHRQYVQLQAESRAMQKQLQHLTYKLLCSQEEERKRISRELHDEISQILTGINVRLAALKIEASTNTGNVTRKITNAQRLVEKSVATVHRFARELRPAMLDDLGLIPALTAYLKDARKRAGLQIRFSVAKAVTTLALDSAQRTVLYRIAQEAITNIIKHAHASRVTICLQSDATNIFLEVNDNGKSFSVSHALVNKSCKHLGLIGMRERAEMLGGKFDIKSAPGNGTSIHVHIPLHNGTGKKLKKDSICSQKMENS